MKILGPCQLLLCLVVVTAAVEDTSHQPVQFCKQDGSVSLDFCLAVTPYRNLTSLSTDLYVTITRRGPLRHGWLAVGLGPAMSGALIFVLQAKDNQNPSPEFKTSVRTATGHHEPRELSGMVDLAQRRQMPDIRVIESSYHDGPPSSPGPGSASDGAEKPGTGTGTAHILIYSPHLWPRTSIDPASSSQPWIWAHNPSPQISSSSAIDTAESIQMHSSFGFFWTDFHSALSATATTTATTPTTDPAPPAFPHADDPSRSHLTTTTPPPIYRLGGPRIRNWMFHLHGLLACLATIVLYPLGALLLRTSDPRAFNFHWTTQSFASVLLVLGAVLGWTLSRRIELVHQVLGLLVTSCVALQLLLGWRHHVIFLKSPMASSWMGSLHRWTGRGIVVAGWVNVLVGVKASGYGTLTVVAVGLVVCLEGALMLRVLGLRNTLPDLSSALGKEGPGRLRRRRQQQQRQQGQTPGTSAAVDGQTALDPEYFELIMDDDDLVDAEVDHADEDYDEDGRLKSDVEWEERMRRERREHPSGHDAEPMKSKLHKLDVV